MLDVAGQDSTEAFEDVGHSDEAREVLEKLYVGELKRQVRNLVPNAQLRTTRKANTHPFRLATLAPRALPLAATLRPR